MKKVMISGLVLGKMAETPRPLAAAANIRQNQSSYHFLLGWSPHPWLERACNFS
jgi:hypothetical protein